MGATRLGGEPGVILRVDLFRTTYTTSACSSKLGRRLRTRTATFRSDEGRAAQASSDRDESYEQATRRPTGAVPLLRASARQYQRSRHPAEPLPKAAAERH